MALILNPFMQFAPLPGSILWFYAKILMAMTSILIVLSMLDDPKRPFPMWGKAVAAGLSLRPIEGDLVHGNVNLFILFLVAISLYAFCQRRDTWPGSCWDSASHAR